MSEYASLGEMTSFVESVMGFVFVESMRHETVTIPAYSRSPCWRRCRSGRYPVLLVFGETNGAFDVGGEGRPASQE